MGMITITSLIALTLSFSSIIFPTILAADTQSTAHPDVGCAQKMCTSGGPAVRFPFQLREKQPEDCAYNSGYTLYCDEMNRTILELPPSSTRVVVTNIDYFSQTMQVQSLQSCFAKQSRDIDVSATPFQFVPSGYYQEADQFSLFNCSPSKGLEDSYSLYNVVHCLDDHGYQVYAMMSSDPIWDLVELLESCTKMYDTNYKWVSRQILDSKFMKLSWSLPHCRKCEVRGGTCGWKNKTSNEIGCFGVKEDHSGRSRTIRVSGSIIGCLSLMVAIGASYLAYSRRKLDQENHMRLKKFLEDYTAMKPTRYSYADIKKITNDFKDKLGEGGYGNVFKGKVSNEVLVAVKLLYDSTGNGDEFINEVGTMGATHHVNVVRLLGFCADGAKRALVYEFLPNGSLDKFIFPDGQEHHALGMARLEEIAIGIARGIDYLHQGCEQRILHFDIKPHNILLDENYNPKISDFGLAKLCEKGRSAVSMTAARGTMGYIAPEVFSRQFGNVTHKSDIYSFGMLLLEMVGRRKNIDAAVKNVSQINFPEWVYGCLVNEEELRIQVVEDEEVQIAKKLAIVGLWCIQWNPVDRPSIRFVLQMLEGSGKDLSLPPNPFTSDIPDNPAEPNKQRKPFNSGLAMISESD